MVIGHKLKPGKTRKLEQNKKSYHKIKENHFMNLRQIAKTK